MIKFLVIFALVVYILSKIGSFFFRVGAASQQNRNFQERKRDGFGAPGTASKKDKGGQIKGGEYVDYEEVK